VLALLKGIVSFFKASRVLSPKCSLLELSVRYYIARHARVLMISDKERLRHAKQRGSQCFMLLKEVFWPLPSLTDIN
jgi:hypothetical protein